MEIRLIKPTETYFLRQKVLKTSNKYEYKYQNDSEISTKHYGAFIDSINIGIVSIMKNKHTLFNGIQVQLRGMAIAKTHQGNGIGLELIEFVLKDLNLKTDTILWCNAREQAVDFYKKKGFKIKGKRFFIENVCFHYLMFLKIK
ncbi:MAG: GNAT family N-acetyltransferase [Flavobacteriaceae bacterium]